jgi:hypothetical protein
MATLQQVGAAVHGFPYALRWLDFAKVKSSKRPPMQAFTRSQLSFNGGHVALVAGAYVLRGVSVRVSINKKLSWAVGSAETKSLLNHEQGHFDITGLVARDLIRKVLDLSVSVSELATLPEAGKTAAEQKQYAFKKFKNAIKTINQEAAALMDRLQSSRTGVDGAYDAQTKHSQNQAGQERWDKFFKQMKTSTDDLPKALARAGLA